MGYISRIIDHFSHGSDGYRPRASWLLPAAAAAFLGAFAGGCRDNGYKPAQKLPQKPAKTLVRQSGEARQYDTNSDPNVDLVTVGDDIRFLNRAEGVLGGRFGYGWEQQTRAAGVRAGDGGRYDAADPNAPDNVWIGRPYGTDDGRLRPLDPNGGADPNGIPITPELRKRIAAAMPAGMLQSPSWIVVDGADGMRSYYFNPVHGPDGRIDIGMTTQRKPDMIERY